MPNTMRWTVTAVVAFLAVFVEAQPAPAGEVSVQVIVRMGTGGTIDSAYVAAVAPDRTWSQPSVELIALDGQATLRLTPGDYTLVVGAKGFEDERRGIRVVPDLKPITFALRPSEVVKGTVRDSSGRPLPNARISDARFVMPQAFGAIGDVGRRFFLEQTVVNTSDSGQFALSPHGGGRTLVLIEASGHTPSIAFSDTTQGKAMDTTLDVGSILRVHFDRTDADLIVTLFRDPDGSSAVPEAWQSWIWSRTVKDREVSWDSLPSGRFRLIGRYADPRKFSERMALATVELARGEETSISVTLPRPIVPANGIAPLFIDLRQKVEGLDIRQLKSAGLLAFAPNALGQLEEVAHAIEQTSGGFLLYLNTSDLADAYCLSKELIVVPDLAQRAGKDTVPAVVARRANLQLTLISKSTSLLPSTAKAVFGHCQSANEIALTTFIAASGKIELPVPIHCKSVVLQLPPFEPVLLEIQLQAGELRNAGSFSVDIGAAANLRVIRGPDGAPVRAAVVRVLAVGENNTRVTTVVGTTNAEGRLSLRGIPVNRPIFVEALDPQSKISGVVQLLLTPGELTQIDPLRIPRPGSIVLTPRLSPDFRARFAEASIVSVTLDPAEPATASRQTEPLDDEGRSRFDRLVPGTWKPVALLEAGGMVQPIRLAPVIVEAGDVKQITADVRPLVFDGIVRSGDQGFATRIAFREEPSRESMVRFAQSNAEGRFSIILPAEGIYGVQLTPPGERTLIDIGEVTFQDPATTVSIQVPAGDMRVIVKNGNRATPDAAITATMAATSARGGINTLTRTAQTDANGEARIAHIPRGRWLITARASDGNASAQKTLDVDSPAEIELQLSEELALEGFVHNADDAPIQDGTINCLFTSLGGVPQMAQAETASDGRFRVRLPVGTNPLLQCGVATRSGRIGAFTTHLTNSADFTLANDSGGVLFPDWGEKLTPHRYWLVARDGRAYNLTWAASKLGALWSPLSITGLPQGSWRLIRIDTFEDWARLATSGANALSPIAIFDVRENEVTQVRIRSHLGRRDEHETQGNNVD
ncbi:MAG TPA: carboxypeptidase-like regulatory domain-containing protein [Thermoanaerobaculia bacterium]|nr:carboxypeptidase-like regulatory domain-containing protein [Thermoanaerobaculia bacterium]